MPRSDGVVYADEPQPHVVNRDAVALAIDHITAALAEMSSKGQLLGEPAENLEKALAVLGAEVSDHRPDAAEIRLRLKHNREWLDAADKDTPRHLLESVRRGIVQMEGLLKQLEPERKAEPKAEPKAAEPVGADTGGLGVPKDLG